MHIEKICYTIIVYIIFILKLDICLKKKGEKFIIKVTHNKLCIKHRIGVNE